MGFFLHSSYIYIIEYISVLHFALFSIYLFLFWRSFANFFFWVSFFILQVYKMILIIKLKSKNESTIYHHLITVLYSILYVSVVNSRFDSIHFSKKKKIPSLVKFKLSKIRKNLTVVYMRVCLCVNVCWVQLCSMHKFMHDKCVFFKT